MLLLKNNNIFINVKIYNIYLIILNFSYLKDYKKRKHNKVVIL